MSIHTLESDSIQIICNPSTAVAALFFLFLKRDFPQINSAYIFTLTNSQAREKITNHYYIAGCVYGPLHYVSMYSPTIILSIAEVKASLRLQGWYNHSVLGGYGGDMGDYHLDYGGVCVSFRLLGCNQYLYL